MKEKLILSTSEFENSTKIGQIYFVGDNLSNDSEYICFIDGYIVDDGFNESKIIDIFKEKGIKGFNDFSGQYNIIIYSVVENKLYFTNDFFAPLSLYYYKNDNGLFILTNNFWRVVDILNPVETDIDQEIVAQLAIYELLLDKRTIIKGAHVMETASNYEYDITNNILKSYKYDDYSSFTEIPMTLEEAVDKFQGAIIEAADYIKAKHKNEKIGISVSGGLDSRIVPKLFGKDAEYFVITGPMRIKKWAKPYNFTYIDKIGDAYGVKIKKINQADTPYEEKVYLDMKKAPLRGADIGKMVSSKNLDFKVLLTSGSPDLLSSARSMYESGWSMWDLMEKYQGHRYIKINKQKRSLKSILKFIFVDKPNTFQTYNLDYIDFYPVKILDKESFYNRAHEIIEKTTHMKENSQNAIMIENYDMVSVESSLGAFESIGGQMRVAYTYFYPWAYKVLKHVPYEHIFDRRILKRLIEKYYPEVADIASEHSISGIHNEHRISSWNIIKTLVLKQLGGFSSMGNLYPAQKRIALRLFDKECSWYDHIFDGKSVRKTIDTQEDIFVSHLKIKLLLNAIEHKDWKKYLD